MRSTVGPGPIVGLCLHDHASSFKIRYGLVVRIAGSHPAGLGSIPGNGANCTSLVGPLLGMNIKRSVDSSSFIVRLSIIYTSCM